MVPPSPDVFDSNQCAFLRVPRARPEVASETETGRSGSSFCQDLSKWMVMLEAARQHKLDRTFQEHP